MELAIDAVDNEYGQTPLSWATKKGHEAVLRLLLYKGATVDVVDKSGRTPLSWDAERGHEAMVQLLLHTRGATNVVDKSG
jgi:ankyrin repeat protein